MRLPRIVALISLRHGIPSLSTSVRVQNMTVEVSYVRIAAATAH
jgi:hypothetical protein